MSNASIRATHYARALLTRLTLLFFVVSGPLQATVTWDGTNGVANWLQSSTHWTPSTKNGCLNCHTPGEGAYSGYPLNTYTDATAVSTLNSPQTRAQEIARRATLPRENGDCMPATASPCPSVSNTDLVSTWVNQPVGPVENAPPSVQTIDATSILRTTATLNGAVNANGRNTWYVFEWGLNDGGMNFTDQTPLPLPPTTNTNGGLVPENVSLNISNLTCETDFQFRVGATNDDPSMPPFTFSYGSTLLFTTSACDFPVVRFGGSEVSGVGRTVTVPIVLEGDASTVYTYPINIQYQVSGTAASGDLDLVSGTLPINTPDTFANLTFNIIGNTNAPADETVVIDVTAATDGSGNPNATVPMPSTYTVVIAGNDNAPTAPPLQVSQAGLNSQYVFKDKGEVTVTANENGGSDNYLYNWDATDSRLLGGVSGNQYAFDPAAPPPGLTPGPYVVSVAIDDGQQTTHQTVTLWIDENAPSLSCGLSDDADGNGICDELEGYGDFDFDGLPDHLDPIGDPTLLNTQVSPSGDNDTRLITTTAGLSLSLNDTAVQLVAIGDATGAKFSANKVVNDPGFSVLNGVFDFQIRGLSAAQRTAQVVIPLDNPMPSQARYRKLTNAAWSDFVETATDGIRSAKSNAFDNDCPPPGDPAYQNGLFAFNDCLELTLTDGGPNDADGEANGVIKDPGGVAVPASAPAPTSSDLNSSPGGAGALGWLWLMMLAPLLLLQHRFR